MILIFHILIALSSIAYTSYLFFSPSKSKLRISYALVALTLITGTYLVALNPSHIVSACRTGLLYLGVIFFGIFSVQRKLAQAKDE